MVLTKSLLAQGKSFQLLEPVFFRSTINDRILEQGTIGVVMVHDSFASGTGYLPGRLQFPRVSLLVVNQTRVVIALVEILEDRREDLRGLVRKSNALWRLFDIVFQELSKVGCSSKDIVMCSEKAVFVADYKRDDGTDAAAAVRIQTHKK